MRLVEGGGGHGEPEDGWVSSAPLFDNVHVTITLCMFTGFQSTGSCPERQQGRHPDVECQAVYVLAERALRMQLGELAQLCADPPANLTAPSAWDKT